MSIVLQISEFLFLVILNYFEESETDENLEGQGRRNLAGIGGFHILTQSCLLSHNDVLLRFSH